MQAFGKAGSAALGAEANSKEAGKRQGRGGALPGQLELKPGAARGLYAGPMRPSRQAKPSSNPKTQA